MEAPTGQRFCVVPATSAHFGASANTLGMSEPQRHPLSRPSTSRCATTCTRSARWWARSCANRAARGCWSWWKPTASPPSAAAAGSRRRAAELAAQVRERPPALARDLVRAFSMWFQAVNLAEKVHRIRRRRDYFVKDSQRPQPGGVEDALAALKAQGYEAPEVLRS